MHKHTQRQDVRAHVGFEALKVGYGGNLGRQARVDGKSDPLVDKVLFRLVVDTADLNTYEPQAGTQTS